jgi:hypothetical protein
MLEKQEESAEFLSCFRLPGCTIRVTLSGFATAGDQPGLRTRSRGALETWQGFNVDAGAHGMIEILRGK